MSFIAYCLDIASTSRLDSHGNKVSAQTCTKWALLFTINKARNLTGYYSCQKVPHKTSCRLPYEKINVISSQDLWDILITSFLQWMIRNLGISGSNADLVGNIHRCIGYQIQNLLFFLTSDALFPCLVVIPFAYGIKLVSSQSSTKECPAVPYS